MKLTKTEEEFCRKFGTPDEEGNVHCDDCPLDLSSEWEMCCYATISRKEAEEMELRRY